MIRAPMGDSVYWTKWGDYGQKQLAEEWQLINKPSQNPDYDPQFTFDTAKSGHLRQLLTLYSRGDAVGSLAEQFTGLLHAWELSNHLAGKIGAEHKLDRCRDWVFELSNLNHYNWCFWLVGLGLSLEIPDDQWNRLLALIGGEGEDELLDRVIGSRQKGRKVGSVLLHPKPYARLLKAIDAPQHEQALLLRAFVEHWYEELERPARDELWWYVYGDPVKHPLEGGSYFGRWCIEAVAAVKAFGLDDSLCLGHEHYPGDLLRPNGPSTHPVRAVEPQAKVDSSWFGKVLATLAALVVFITVWGSFPTEFLFRNGMPWEWIGLLKLVGSIGLAYKTGQRVERRYSKPMPIKRS